MDEIILGFDYGTKRIGVAVGQTITHTARPLTTVQVRRNKPDWRHISQLIDEWRPQRLLVGVPLNMRGEQQDMTRAALRFLRQLTGRYRLPVAAVDERLSTRTARRHSTGRGPVDPIAAQLIVEAWFADGELVL